MLSYDYTPMTEQEAQRERYNLLPDGDYDIFVEKSVGKISASGNPMAELYIAVFDKDGRPVHIKDYLIFTPSMAWKLLHFCESADLVTEYKAKQFRPELADQRGARARIRTQQGKEIPHDKLNGKPPGSRYPDKNVIEDYVKKDPTNLAQSDNKVSGIDPEFDDAIPF